jgi:uncharacterized protein (TIGR01319 family)
LKLISENVLSTENRDESYLIVNIDNHLTKAIYIDSSGEDYFIRGKGETPTTVDPPDLDVTVGLRRVVVDLGNSLGKELWGDKGPSNKQRFLCSSSTSGGLHMTVAGVVRRISAESAERAALGAGALLMDVLSINDGRPNYKKIARMRSLRPDMFLLAGGTDGGAVSQVIDMATLVDTADVRPRFGSGYKLPVIYAGNIAIRDRISKTLTEERYATRVVENVRPNIEKENLGPAREGIYDSYMEHVIIHSPGYDKLVNWVDGHIIPTQAAIGRLLYAYAEKRRANLLAVDVGGATTDVYSVYGSVFNRSLNADIGMTYGILNVMKEAGIQNVMRWIPEEMSEKKVRNIIANIMALQPRSLSEEEAMVQRACAREAIMLGLLQHRKIASKLKGVRVKLSLDNIFEQEIEFSLVDPMNTQILIGRGKIFDNNNTEGEAALLLIDAVQPEGVTEIMVDTSSILPHLGMLLERNKDAALGLMSTKSLRKLGTCLAPKGTGKEGADVMRLRMTYSDGDTIEETIHLGEVKSQPLSAGESATIEATPTGRFDVGKGRGKRLVVEVSGGEHGVIIDARGRPLTIPKENEVLALWREALKGEEAT